MRTMPALAAAGVATLALVPLAVVPAHANDADVIRTGACSGRSDWKLKLSPENGRIEAEFEVDSNVVGQSWRVRIRHNGELVYRQLKVTQAPSGSFTARVVVPNEPGEDLVRARAVNVASEEACVGSARF